MIFLLWHTVCVMMILFVFDILFWTVHFIVSFLFNDVYNFGSSFFFILFPVLF